MVFSVGNRVMRTEVGSLIYRKPQLDLDCSIQKIFDKLIISNSKVKVNSDYGIILYHHKEWKSQIIRSISGKEGRKS